MASHGPKPSAPFLSREFNGEQLLEELGEIRNAQVRNNALFECVAALKELDGLPIGEAVAHLKQLAAGRFGGQGTLPQLLLKWAGRLKAEADLPLLVDHLERLALTAAMVGALKRATERMGKAGEQ
jgi:hypothetical protein